MVLGKYKEAKSRNGLGYLNEECHAQLLPKPEPLTLPARPLISVFEEEDILVRVYFRW